MPKSPKSAKSAIFSKYYSHFWLKIKKVHGYFLQVLQPLFEQKSAKMPKIGHDLDELWRWSSTSEIDVRISANRAAILPKLAIFQKITDFSKYYSHFWAKKCPNCQKVPKLQIFASITATFCLKYQNVTVHFSKYYSHFLSKKSDKNGPILKLFTHNTVWLRFDPWALARLYSSLVPKK